MAEIVLNVELRDGAGTGNARAVRRQDKVPGVLYGGPKGPEPTRYGDWERKGIASDF